MTGKKVKILIVDDSEVIVQVLCAILKDVPDFEIIGTASNGSDAIKKTKQLKPDIITMDIHMPNMDGIQATKYIMAEHPTPIVIISSHTNKEETNNAFEALTYGALTVFEKPENILDPSFDKQKVKLIKLIRAMSEIKVIRRRQNFIETNIKPENNESPSDTSASRKILLQNELKIIGLGASTGGPEALSCILSSIRYQLTHPIVIVLHIADNFLEGFIDWLQKEVRFPIHIARQNEHLKAGNIYFAPDATHLYVKNTNGFPHAFLSNKDTNHNFMPSINVLFNSLANNFPKTSMVGLLTGMGRDGVQGMLDLKKAGGFTFTQSERTSVVYGMAAQAVQVDASHLTLDLEEIGPFLAGVMSNQGG